MSRYDRCGRCEHSRWLHDEVPQGWCVSRVPGKFHRRELCGCLSFVEPTDAPPASAPRPDTDSIQARVQKSRDLRADAGEEMIRVRGTAGATLRVPNDLPAWARSLDYEHDHVRWANAKLLELESALASRDAEIARLREALKAARASLAKIHVSDGSYPVYHLICDVLDHPARALAAPPDTTTETPHG